MKSPSADNSTTAALARELAQATRAGVYLGEALEAAADATRSRGIARALRAVAERVNRGEPLEQILDRNSPLPPHLSGLVRASLATGQPALAIAEWLFARERARTHWNNVLTALHYPLATLLGTYVLYVSLSRWLVPDISQMLDEFQIKIPEPIRAIYWFAQKGAPISLWVLGVTTVLLLLLRIFGGRAVWSQFMTAVPLVGPLWHWSGSSEFYRALAILLDRQIALPQALQLTADGISDAALAAHSRQLATQIEQGASLTRAIQQRPELPASTFPLIHAGEQTGTLPGSLRTAAELLESRLEVQSSVILQLAPTVVFLLIVGLVGMLVAGFLIPLMTLIRGLT